MNQEMELRGRRVRMAAQSHLRGWKWLGLGSWPENHMLCGGFRFPEIDRVLPVATFRAPSSARSSALSAWLRGALNVPFCVALRCISDRPYWLGWKMG